MNGMEVMVLIATILVAGTQAGAMAIGRVVRTGAVIGVAAVTTGAAAVVVMILVVLN